MPEGRERGTVTGGIEIFDHLPDGRAVQAIRLRGPRLAATVLTLGATVQDLRLDGVQHPLVLGFPTAAAYLGAGLYSGAIVGRFANRIGGARFTLDGIEYRLEANEGRNLLHGGADGLHARLWQVVTLREDSVTLTATLPDGHMGFPGELRIAATLSVPGDALEIELRAEAEAPTPVSLAHHGYFTLDGRGDSRGHRLRLAADHYLPVDDALIPTGEIAPVAGTAFDFRTARPIGDAGYDHNFCLSPARGPLRPVAWLQGQDGIQMRVETTEPGLQLYDGRHFAGVPGLDGRVYGPHAGVALETQGWPDAPNRPGFPPCILRPGQDWCARTRHVFLKSGQSG
ncbi:hypothetical protein B6K69_06900 [Fuscovulum blasticum]|nr:hypothetical protein B6K69_06900 [Fuscovulum blasticum]